MHFDIQLGFLAADAILEFSKTDATKDATHYEAFVEYSIAYYRELRNIYGHPLGAEISASVPVP